MKDQDGTMPQVEPSTSRTQRDRTERSGVIRTIVISTKKPTSAIPIAATSTLLQSLISADRMTAIVEKFAGTREMDFLVVEDPVLPVTTRAHDTFLSRIPVINHAPELSMIPAGSNVRSIESGTLTDITTGLLSLLSVSRGMRPKYDGRYLKHLVNYNDFPELRNILSLSPMEKTPGLSILQIFNNSPRFENLLCGLYQLTTLGQFTQSDLND